MKTILLLTLAHLAISQPHRHRHARIHHRRQLKFFEKVETVTAVAPLEVVYINDAGTPVSTAYVSPITGTPTPEPVGETPSPAGETDVVMTTPVTTEAAAPMPTPAPTPSPPPSLSQHLSTMQPAMSTPSLGSYAITYSPYHADGTCKTGPEVAADVSHLTGYSMLRIYGTDCNQVATVGAAAKSAGMKLFAGVFDIGAVASEIATMAAAAQSLGWGMFDTISIGNELVNTGAATAEQVVAAVAQARTLLSAAGFDGHVVTVDTFNAIIANPSLCAASDYAAANAHAFFDPDVVASGAGAWVAGVKKQVAAACPGKQTVITESGWPSCGSANGAAVPNAANQVAALASLKSAVPAGGLVVFTAYNDLWKQNFQGSFGAEQCWGILGTSSN